MSYDPGVRLAPCPEEDACEIQGIEIEFAIPIHLTQDQQRRFIELIQEITECPWNKPVDGVHWLCRIGSKPYYSQVDAAYLGKPVDPDAPVEGEPQQDDDILHFETAARAAYPNETGV